MRHLHRILFAVAASVVFVGVMDTACAQIRVLPLGDSITQGVFPSQSYRYRFWAKCRAAGYPIDCLGSRTDNYSGHSYYPAFLGAPFDRQHEGHGGWRSVDLLDGCTSADPCGRGPTANQGNLLQWIFTYTADVALIHVGSNDVFQQASWVTTAISIWLMIDVLRYDNPHTVIFLAQIIPLPGNRGGPTSVINTIVPLIAQARSTPQSPIIVVDHHTGWNPVMDTVDGTHPNVIGEEKMARKWFDAFHAVYGAP